MARCQAACWGAGPRIGDAMAVACALLETSLTTGEGSLNWVAFLRVLFRSCATLRRGTPKALGLSATNLSRAQTLPSRYTILFLVCVSLSPAVGRVGFLLSTFGYLCALQPFCAACLATHELTSATHQPPPSVSHYLLLMPGHEWAVPLQQSHYCTIRVQEG